jgi:hypothetical protein
MGGVEDQEMHGLSKINTLRVLPLLFGLALFPGKSALALPPATDQPEEVLRTQIITAARSPIDGKPMSAVEYAQLQAEAEVAPPSPPQISAKVRKTVNLLKLRKFIKTFFPFVPIR